MGSCGTKIPKEHSYTQPKSTNSNHRILEEISDDEGENFTHQNQKSHHSSHQNSSSTSYRENNDGSINTHNKSNGVSTMNRSVASNKSITYSPTYQKLREMGFDSELAKEASDKYPINVNDAMEYAWTKQN